MRTVSLLSVYEAIARRHGFDPHGDAITQDTARAILQHINRRVRVAYAYWDFPDLSHTEERAFRQVWNTTHEYHRTGQGWQGREPDEVFYIPSMRYYVVRWDATADPPAGTPPATQNLITNEWVTNTTYFADLSPVDPYISYDQTCRHPMGQVLGVYATNPRLNGNGCCNPYDIGLSFRPSEKGIDVCPAPGPTVFVHYMLTEPKFTFVPWTEGKYYNLGDRVFYVDNCYRVIRANTGYNPPPDPDFWTIEPFPEMLEDYVVPGAYADGLKESVSELDPQTRLALASAAEAEADGAIQSMIDQLIAQGQKHYWMKPWSWYGYSSGCWCQTQPWSGQSVTTLKEGCEGEPIYSVLPVTETVQWEYFPQVVALRASDASPALDQIVTTTRAVGSVAKIVIDGVGKEYRLVSAAADSSDPGHVAPLDYSASINNKHWEQFA